MKHVSCLLILFYLMIFDSSIFGSSAKVSVEYGYDPVDATVFLQQALNANHSFDTIIVDNVGEWITQPLDVKRDSLTIIFEVGTVVTAKENAFNDVQAKLFRIRDKKNVHFIGYGATLRMQKEEYIVLDDSEFRHVLSFNACSDISVIGLELRDSGGDGVSVGPGFLPTELEYSTNVLIRDCFMDNNYRQGISVTSAKNLIIENCYITNTWGTLPQSGIDFEPFREEHIIQNCEVRNCRIVGNGGRGIQNGFGDLDSNSAPIDVLIEDTYIAENGWNNPISKGAALTVQSGNFGPTGGVVMRNCIIENQPYNGIYTRTGRDIITLSLENVVIRNVANDTSELYNHPIVTEINYTEPLDPFGAISFKNVTIEDDVNRPFFYALGFFGPNRILGDITGSVDVINPDSVYAYFGPPGGQDNVTLTVTDHVSWPMSTINMRAVESVALEEEPQNGVISFERLEGLSSMTMPVIYDVNGSADNRLDYRYLNQGLVIPANTSSREIELIARADEISDTPEMADFTLIAQTPIYQIGNSSTATITINQGNSSNVTPPPFQTSGMVIYPNPVSDVVFLELDVWPTDNLRLKVYDMLGRLKAASDYTIGIDQKIIDLSDLFLPLDNGNYVVTAHNLDGSLFSQVGAVLIN